MSFRLVPNSVTLDDLERRNGHNGRIINVVVKYRNNFTEFPQLGEFPGEVLEQSPMEAEDIVHVDSTDTQQYYETKEISVYFCQTVDQ